MSVTLTRRQLTLFVTGPWRERLEVLRTELDPVQAGLIPAHVTLCREDEIANLSPEALFERVESWADGPIILAFGAPTRFSGHGILLPCEQGSDAFQRLRHWVLQDPAAREHSAHLTLAHPRNPKSPGNTDAAMDACPRACDVVFASVALIEQHGSDPWRVRRESTLGLRVR